jgi:hypothetical protein
MQLIQYFSNGTMFFNWEQLPEHIKSNIDLRDKLFKELQEKIKLNDSVTSRALFELNRYAVERIKKHVNKNQ